MVYDDGNRSQRVRERFVDAMLLASKMEEGTTSYGMQLHLENVVYCVKSPWVLIKIFILVGCHLVLHADPSFLFLAVVTMTA